MRYIPWFSYLLLAHLYCLAQPGHLDTTFGTGGIAWSNVLLNGKMPVTFGKMAMLPNQKILMVSNVFNEHTVLSRFNSTGEPDSSFGQAGIICISKMIANDIAIAYDGKIVVAGTDKLSSGSRKQLLIRLHANGTIDKTFGNQGRLYIAGGTDDSFNAVICLPAGKILAAGSVKTGAVYQFCISRFVENGNPDASFNGTGTQIIPIGSVNDAINDISLYSNGRIIAGGTSRIGSYDNFAFACLNANGGLYNGFDGDGILTVPMGTQNAGCNQVHVLADQSKVVATGWAFNGTNTDFAVAVFNSDGSPDNSFDTDGKALYNPSNNIDQALSSHLGEGGKISLVGYSHNGSNYDFSAMRILPDGMPDNMFNGSGKVSINYGGYNDVAATSALLPDGTLLLGGYSFLGSNNSHAALAKLDVNGALVNGFGIAGKQTYPMGQSAESVRAVAMQADGKLLVGGGTFSINSTGDFAILRFTSNGQVDPSFGSNGRAFVSFNTTTNSEVATALAVQKDGKIIVAGDSYGSGLMSVGFARLNANGTPDNSFDGDGKVLYSFGGVSHYVSDVALQEDGKIVAAIYSFTAGYYNFILLRLNENGSLDNSFDGDGMVVTDLAPATNDLINSIRIQPDGKIVAAGFSGPGGLAVARYNTDGSLDNSFSGDGKLVMNTQGLNNCEGMALQADGKIVLAGSAEGTETNVAIVRLLANGDPDPSFGTNGVSVGNAFAGGLDVGTGAAILPGGKIVISGVRRSQVIDGYIPFITQFNENGSPDTQFGNNGYFIISDTEMPSSDYLWNNLVVKGNKAYCAGFFNTFDTDLFLASVEVGPTSAAAIYRFTGNGNFSDPLNWEAGIVPPNPLPANAEIIISPAVSGAACILNIPYQVAAGGKFTVLAGKLFSIPGSLNIQ